MTSSKGWSAGSKKGKFYPCVCCGICHTKNEMVEVCSQSPTDEMAASVLLLCITCAGCKLETLLEDVHEVYAEEFLQRSL